MKFRIWSKKYKLFTDDPRWPSNQHTHAEFLLAPDGEVWCLVGFDKEDYSFRDLNCGEFIVQRATGLKDKNNREIYDGDILFLEDGSNCKVIFDVGAFQCCCLTDHNNYDNDRLEESRYLNYWDEGSLVIGNILENPELC